MNKIGSHFRAALLAIGLSVFVFSAAFFTENQGATGFAVSEEQIVSEIPSKFIDSHSLSQLSPGNYYISYEGIIYWMDDSSRPAVAILRQEEDRGRQFYVSKEGTVTFV